MQESNFIYIEFPVKVMQRGFLKLKAEVVENRKEYNEVDDKTFNILLVNKFINADGGWIQHSQLWPIFMRGKTDGRI